MLRKIAQVAVCLALLVSLPLEANAGRSKRGIVGKRAPAWNVSTWFNLPAGKRKVDITDYRGKVVYLFFFQSWCPGCHKHGFPALVSVAKHFSGNDNVAFVAVQTVFEGFEANTSEAALESARTFDLSIPVGHDTGPGGNRSYLMKRYRSGGTPWLVIIDKSGVVRFDDFHQRAGKSIAVIQALLAVE